MEPTAELEVVAQSHTFEFLEADKPYYLAAAYSLAFAAGAVAVEGATSGRARWLRPALVALVVAVGLGLLVRDLGAVAADRLDDLRPVERERSAIQRPALAEGFGSISQPRRGRVPDLNRLDLTLDFNHCLLSRNADVSGITA